MDIIFKEESYQIMGACFEVYNEKGPGFLEAVYQECLRHELRIQGVPFLEQPQLDLTYKGHLLNHTYKPDYVCHDKIIVEIKAVSSLHNDHRGQVHNYLKATSCRLGLLVNFGNNSECEWERIAN